VAGRGGMGVRQRFVTDQGTARRDRSPGTGRHPVSGRGVGEGMGCMWGGGGGRVKINNLKIWRFGTEDGEVELMHVRYIHGQTATCCNS
jgi:hypothetical protein